MADPFVAEIRIYPFNFAPRGWAFCNGQIMPISQNTALFSLLGTTYGGDGKSTFALPDLQGAAPMHPGQGPGLSLRDLGETGGAEFVTLTDAEMPSHAHTLQGFVNPIAPQPGNSVQAAGNALAALSEGAGYVSGGPSPNVANMALQAVGIAGGSQPHNNMQPYLTLNFCIALQGIFPARP
jgi:microcystin-dependent protein